MASVANITLGQAWEWILALAAAIYAIAKAYEVIKGARRKLPCQTNSEDLRQIHRALDRDKERLDRQDTANAVMFRTLLAQINHMLTGNSIDKLREARDEIQDFLTKR
jgi:hypothetical protein